MEEFIRPTKLSLAVVFLSLRVYQSVVAPLVRFFSVVIIRFRLGSVLRVPHVPLFPTNDFAMFFIPPFKLYSNNEEIVPSQ